MIKFDFRRFMLRNNLGIMEIAKKTGCHYKSISLMVKRGTIKYTFKGKFEKTFGDLSQYIEA